ncbi:flavodoxin domain-containing protein [Pseudomonas panipatensis]|jgi:MioC protein|uniref:MioC protein n=1 Tax=Pseudomonas panipatensis TaxID=428992 RepID=A0A1G8HHM5_9PSED|nr:flavodoxin domain-containing protein [Pseudomonas panipatensis]SDI06207.1 MioC protein [Pseudomonas panipatensis]SMP58346.1 MioC protein [Pseudomonas panipatensis]
MKMIILFGTETGNAEMVADDVAEALGADYPTVVRDMSAFDPSELKADDFHLVICSTYGDGELPNSAQPFFAALQQQRPDLRGLRFAAFGLGDSFYQTFNRGSQLIADALKQLGATQVGEHGQHDASSGELPGDVALAWTRTLLGQL